MKKYIADWDANVAKSKNAAEMRQNVLKDYPGLGMDLRSTIASIRTFRPKPRRSKPQKCTQRALSKGMMKFLKDHEVQSVELTLELASVWYTPRNVFAT